MVSSGNNNFLTCINCNVKCIGNIKVLKFYLVVGTYVDEMGPDGIANNVGLGLSSDMVHRLGLVGYED